MKDPTAAANKDHGVGFPTEAHTTPAGAPRLAAAVAVAIAAACAAFAGVALSLWGNGPAILVGLDFNAGLFEDFLGPYWTTSRGLLDGLATPAPGYLYPSTLAWILTPFAWLQARFAGPGAGGSMIPSWAAAAFVLVSLSAFVMSVFALARPKSLEIAALAGALFGVAHAPVHGAYWAQASLPAIAGLAAGLALFEKRRPVLAGVCIGLAAALKLHPLIGLVALALPWRRGGSSLRATISAALSFALLGVALPLAIMGPSAFTTFHRTILGRLEAMNAWAMTKEGGRGSQDLPAILGRALPLDSSLGRRCAGWVVGAALVWLAVRALRARSTAAPRMLSAFVFLAAVPWAAISPTWPHGLLWVPVSWWIAANCESKVSWVLAAASLMAGSIITLRLFGTPEIYAWYGLPALSAFLAVSATAAAVFDRDHPVRV